MSWRTLYVDLVGGPKNGERIKLPWGTPNYFVMPEQEIPCSLEPPSEVMPNLAQPIMYRARECAYVYDGRTEWVLGYRVEQWSVDGL
jgi:hypothetical protein